MNILVTGGAGFIGSHLSDALLLEGHNVIAYDNLLRGKVSNLVKALTNPNFKFIKGDLLDKDTLFKIFKTNSIDTVCHMAANSDIASSHTNPDVDFENTLKTTYNILLAMKEFNVKNIVFASTSAIYGDTGVKVSEDFGPLFPISHYGASKLASEGYISSFCENYGLKAWSTRFPNVVGERATHGAIYDFINNGTCPRQHGEGVRRRTRSRIFQQIQEAPHGLSSRSYKRSPREPISQRPDASAPYVRSCRHPKGSRPFPYPSTQSLCRVSERQEVPAQDRAD